MSVPVSFEFYPPKTKANIEQLAITAKKLQHYQPEYFSVTYGAGGSTRQISLDTVQMLLKQHLPTTPHISCIGATQESITELLHLYQQQGIRQVVALRGDIPSGEGVVHGDFHYAVDLVRFIRQETGNHFHISVAVYPECHPQAATIRQDLQYFKDKVEAGANDAITQYFYHPDAYARLLDDCARMQIDIPIIPGIMPIRSFSQLTRFSNMCGAEIPRYVRKRLEAFGDDARAVHEFGVEVVSRLCEDLIKLGAPALHFYTLNRSQGVEAILKHLGY